MLEAQLSRLPEVMGMLGPRGSWAQGGAAIHKHRLGSNPGCLLPPSSTETAQGHAEQLAQTVCALVLWVYRFS